MQPSTWLLRLLHWNQKSMDKDFNNRKHSEARDCFNDAFKGKLTSRQRNNPMEVFEIIMELDRVGI